MSMITKPNQNPFPSSLGVWYEGGNTKEAKRSGGDSL